MDKCPTYFEGLDFLHGRRTWDGGLSEQFFGRWKTVLKIIQNGEKIVFKIVQNGEKIVLKIVQNGEKPVLKIVQIRKIGTQKNSEEVVKDTGMG